MCELCKRFDFGTVSALVDKSGARIGMACGDYRYPEETQFKFCPVCGERLKEQDTDGMTNKEAFSEMVSHLIQCGMLMPEEWVLANGDGSKFQTAYGLALKALKTNEVNQLEIHTSS